MVTYKWEDLRGDNLPFVGQMAKGARALACTIWNKYPGTIVDTNPVFAPAKYFWNTVCAEEGINKQPTPTPFQGGQCPVMYNVVYRATVYNASNCVDVFPNPLSVQVLGPISAPQWTPVDPPQSVSSGCFGGGTYRLGNWTSVTGSGIHVWISNAYESPLSQVEIRSIARVDGQPDNCGSLPTSFPPSPPPPAPGDESTDIVINDEGDTDLTIPLGWFDIDFSIPMTFNFEVGDIVVDVGGVTVNFNADNEWDIGENPQPVKLPDEVSNDINTIKDDIKTVKDTQEEEQKKFDKIEYDSETYIVETSLEITESAIDYIEIIVIREPIKGKVITNFNPANTFYWAGYFCWTANGSRAPHNKIEKQANFYARPTWATGAAIFCVNKSQLEVVVYTKKVIPAN